MPEWLPCPYSRLRRLGGDKGRPFPPGMSPRSFDRRRSRHAYASAEKFSCQRWKITINSGIWLGKLKGLSQILKARALFDPHRAYRFLIPVEWRTQDAAVR